jgi:hypothetical protein
MRGALKHQVRMNWLFKNLKGMTGLRRSPHQLRCAGIAGKEKKLAGRIAAGKIDSQVDAVHPGQHHIEDDQRRLPGSDNLKSFFSGIGRSRFVAGDAENCSKGVRCPPLVVNDQNLLTLREQHASNLGEQSKRMLICLLERCPGRGSTSSQRATGARRQRQLWHETSTCSRAIWPSSHNFDSTTIRFLISHVCDFSANITRKDLQQLLSTISRWWDADSGHGDVGLRPALFHQAI